MHQINKETIAPKAREVIDQYLALPFGSKPSCPYFNNKRHKIRGALRAVVGKGTPYEIAEEAEIQAMQSRVNISSMPADVLKQFLVDKNIGIDCSGFAYHVINALSQELTGKSLRRNIFVHRNGLFGSLISRIRASENVNVLAFADVKNSSEINPKLSKPGDIIVFLGTGKEKTYNHILVITAVEHTDKGHIISYAHSYAWPSDGEYNHGVREGTITLAGDDILKAYWLEQGKTGTDNYTLESATDAEQVYVRRMKFIV